MINQEVKKMIKELQELKKNIPNSEIRQFIGSCGLWEYGLFCKKTNLRLDWGNKK